MSVDINGKEIILGTRIFEWHKHFSEGQNEMKTKTDEYVEGTIEVVLNNRLLSVRMIRNVVSIDKKAV